MVVINYLKKHQEAAKDLNAMKMQEITQQAIKERKARLREKRK